MKITDTVQKVACAICEELIADTWEGMESFNVHDFVEKIMKQYNLQTDPFTLLPVTSKEFAKNMAEYHRQVMFERFGDYE